MRDSWSEKEVCHVAEERREATRFGKDPDGSHALLLCSEAEPRLAEVHDESLTGLGLLVEDAAGLEIRGARGVVYLSQVLEGTVRHIERIDDRRYLIGLSCEPLPCRAAAHCWTTLPVVSLDSESSSRR